MALHFSLNNFLGLLLRLSTIMKLVLFSQVSLFFGISKIQQDINAILFFLNGHATMIKWIFYLN